MLFEVKTRWIDTDSQMHARVSIYIHLTFTRTKEEEGRYREAMSLMAKASWIVSMIGGADGWCTSFLNYPFLSSRAILLPQSHANRQDEFKYNVSDRRRSFH